MAPDTARITLFVDRACPMCAREARFMEARDRLGAIRFIDIADPAFDASQHGLDQADVSARMHAIDASGRILTGMEAFRAAYRAIGRGWMIAWTAWPVARPITDAAYRLFARNRHRLGRLMGRCASGTCPTGR